MKKAVFLVASIAVAALLLLLWMRRPTEPHLVRFAYHKISANLPLFVALQRGYFQDHGVKVEPIVTGRTEEQVNALLKGDIDAAGASGFSYLFLVERQEPGKLKIVLPLVEDDRHFSNYLLVGAGSTARTPRDLVGKTVGTYSGSAQRVYLDLVIEALDLRNKVAIKQVEKDLQLQTLASGGFDALFTIDPYGTLAQVRGIGRILVANPRGRYLMSPFPVAAFVFSSRFVKERPTIADGTYKALAKATEFIRTNEDAARTAWNPFLGLEPELLPRLGLYEYQLMEEVDRALLARLEDLLMKSGELETPVDVGPMILTAKDLGR